MSTQDSYNPPRNVRDEAQRALKWIGEGKAGSGFTDVGRARARDLASGRSVSLDTLKRMSSYFSRHEVDKKGIGWSPGQNGYPSPGRVAWAAWGGNAGRAWANSVLSTVSGVTHMSTEDKDQNVDLSKEEIDAYLEHYGVRGQKWGVRRTSSQLHGSNSSKGVTRFKEKPKHLTDQELQDRIKRIETEKRYKDLNKRQVSTGEKHLMEVLTHVGKESAKKLGVYAVMYTSRKAIEKKMGAVKKEEFFKKP
jgi:hypothetical protein